MLTKNKDKREADEQFLSRNGMCDASGKLQRRIEL
jgi:hypothetical protein